MNASGTIAPAGIGRRQGFKACLFIATRTRGADRLYLLEACGLLPYVAAKRPVKFGKTPFVSYRRPGS